MNITDNINKSAPLLTVAPQNNCYLYDCRGIYHLVNLGLHVLLTQLYMVASSQSGKVMLNSNLELYVLDLSYEYKTTCINNLHNFYAAGET